MQKLLILPVLLLLLAAPQQHCRRPTERTRNLAERAFAEDAARPKAKQAVCPAASCDPARCEQCDYSPGERGGQAPVHVSCPASMCADPNRTVACSNCPR